MPKRIGRWTTIATLEDGRTIRAQNTPSFKPTSDEAYDALRKRGIDAIRARMTRAELAERDRRDEDREVRETFGLSVR